MTLREDADRIVRASIRAVQPEAAVQRALEGFSCAVTREGDEYVIYITRRPCEPVEGSVGDPAPSEEESHE